MLQRTKILCKHFCAPHKNIICCGRLAWCIYGLTGQLLAAHKRQGWAVCDSILCRAKQVLARMPFKPLPALRQGMA
jgi:hypothetical protein